MAALVDQTTPPHEMPIVSVQMDSSCCRSPFLSFFTPVVSILRTTSSDPFDLIWFPFSGAVFTYFSLSAVDCDGRNAISAVRLPLREPECILR